MYYYYNKIIEKVKINYLKLSKIKEKNQNCFLNRFCIVNNVNGNVYEPQINVEKTNYENSLYYLNVINYLNEITDKKNLVPLFVTLTSPSKYHLFKSHKKKIILNKNYENYEYMKKIKNDFHKIYDELNKSIKKSYKLLQYETREIIRNYQRKSGKNDIYYFKMFEYHCWFL